MTTTKPKPKRGVAKLKAFDVIRALMQQPRTIDEVDELVESSEKTIRLTLDAAEEAGLVAKSRRVLPPGAGRWPNVYHWCPVPFEYPAGVDPTIFDTRWS